MAMILVIGVPGLLLDVDAQWPRACFGGGRAAVARDRGLLFILFLHRQNKNERGLTRIKTKKCG
ncbi:MAG: hypothetical protein ACREPY_01930 [Rhodanobacteraceae bacterium]